MPNTRPLTGHHSMQVDTLSSILSDHALLQPLRATSWQVVIRLTLTVSLISYVLSSAELHLLNRTAPPHPEHSSYTATLLRTRATTTAPSNTSSPISPPTAIHQAMSPYLSPSTSPSSSRSTSPNPSSPTSLYTISIRITCHCHTLTHILPLPSSSLPLSSALCHCTRCRTTFGSLFSSWVELSGGASSIPADSPCAKPPEELLQKLVQLPFTEKTRLYACGTCGATVFLDWDGGWLLGSGLVDWGALRDEVERVRRVEGEMEGKGEVGLVRRVGEHLAVEHTGDGGAGVWLSGMEGRESDYQSAALGQEWRGEMLDLARRTTEAQGEIGDWIGNVEWSCACGNVSGWLTREDGKGDKFGLRREEHDRKFRGVVSTGKSEGQCNGFEVGAWVVVPRSQIRGAAEMKEWLENIKLGIPQDDADPGIGMYRSSPGVERYWCRTCGARLLLMERKRPGFVKITAGLLRSLTGARAEDWVGWEMDKSGEHAEKALTRDIEQGLQAWNEAMKSALERTDSKQ